MKEEEKRRRKRKEKWKRIRSPDTKPSGPFMVAKPDSNLALSAGEIFHGEAEEREIAKAGKCKGQKRNGKRRRKEK